MAKSRRERDDDDLGFRTPTRNFDKGKVEKKPKKRETGKQKRPATEERSSKRETGKHKRETGKHKRETGKHKRETGKHKRETGKRESVAATAKRAETPPPPRRSNPLPVAAGVLVAVIVGGLVATVMMGGIEDPSLPPEVAQRQREPFKISEGTAPPVERAPKQIQRDAPIVAKIEPSGDLVELEPPPPVEPKQDDLLAELAKRSSTHGAIARLLDEYQRLFDPNAMHSSGPLLDQFRERQKREQELIEQLRGMGPAAVGALKDMLLELDHRQYRIFLGKALAGMDGPDALAAVGDVLSKVKDVALQTTLVRFLPASAEAAAAIAGAIKGEESGNLRTMLLREYNKRLDENDPTGLDVFRQLAVNDPDPNVRAEAVTILGRRGDPQDKGMMEQIIANEKNLSIRQRAIVSYAETGKAESLPFLEQLARNQDTGLPVRASAVLAIGRVGGQQAIQSLDLIAQTDPSQEIRTRANRLAQSLRRRAAEAANPKRMQNPPMRIDPSGGGTGRGPAPLGRN